MQSVADVGERAGWRDEGTRVGECACVGAAVWGGEAEVEAEGGHIPPLLALPPLGLLRLILLRALRCFHLRPLIVHLFAMPMKIISLKWEVKIL